jgi:hypothetical protein
MATMPRSGTWYSFYFFEFLDLFMAGRDSLNTRLDLHVYHALKLGKLHTHCICPGFLEACKGLARSDWDQLVFYTPGYDYGTGRFIEGNQKVFSPLQNPEIRIVYLYRNPLDQIVSYYRHIQKHRQDTTRSFTTESGEELVFTDLSHFLRTAGADGYIKQYWTYHFMREKVPDCLLLLPYEDMVDSPAEAFVRVLKFLDLDLDPDRSALKVAFKKALNAAKPESLKNLETALGSSLGRDQADTEESHLRGGEIGKWTSQLSEEDLRFVQARLNAYSLDLAGFRTEPAK